MNTKLEVGADRVLIKPDPKELQTASGIYLPDNIKKPHITGVVISAGEKSSFAKKGMRILVGVGSISPLVFEDEQYVIARDL